MATLWLDRAQSVDGAVALVGADLLRLWRRLAAVVYDGHDEGGIAADDETDSLGSPAALLASALIARLNGTDASGAGLPEEHRADFNLVANASGRAGRMARAALANLPIKQSRTLDGRMSCRET